MALPRPLRRPRAARRPVITVEPHPDDLPKRGLFAEPVRVTRLDVADTDEMDDGARRVTFLVEIKDAEDKRCSEVAVEVRITGPERSRTVQGATDLFGRLRFRMAGPPGTYHLDVTDVAAGGLDWDAAAGPRQASVDVG